MTVELPPKSKRTPVITKLEFESAGNATKFVDVAASLSALNRRSYAQGCYYYITSVEVYNNSDGYMDIHTLPNTWVLRSAHRRARAIFNKMNAMALEPLTNGILPKYHDFKVYMSALHRQNGNLDVATYGVNGSFDTHTPGDWIYSQFTSADDDHDAIADSDEFHGHMIGPHIRHDGTESTTSGGNWGSIGLIRSWFNTRAQVQYSEPAVPAASSSDPLVNIFDFSSEEQLNDIIRNLDTDNDQPPYDYNNVVGEDSQSMQHVARIGTQVGAGRVGRAPGFVAPLGLLCLDTQGLSATDTWRVVVNLAQGSYKGVLAEAV